MPKDRYGWICDGPLCGGETKNRTFAWQLDLARAARPLFMIARAKPGIVFQVTSACIEASNVGRQLEMLVIPTALWAHTVFDVLGWTASAITGVTLHRWRLRTAAERLALKTGPGYFVALAGGALLGAWAMGSVNTLRMAEPILSHSIAGALAGSIVGVEVYKRIVGLQGSTGTPFVGPLAVGIFIGRWGCLFAGLPDQTYGVPTSLPWAVDL
ncbi:MAG TPA: hypothetical protein VGL95_07080, partial [Acetobacteraceae bacterium]